MEEAEEHLFWPSHDHLCAVHVQETFLRETLEPTDPGERCVICGADYRLTLALDDLSDLVVEALRANWRRAIEHLSYDSESPSGYALVPVLDTYDVVLSDLQGAVDDEVASMVASHLAEEQWFDPASLWLEGSELLQFSWEQFAGWVRSSTTPLSAIGNEPLPTAWAGPQADGIPARHLLPTLVEVVEDAGLIRTVAPGPWYRIVELRAGDVPTPGRLGTAPVHLATQANRFNPPGQPAFYAATDQRTASAETPRSASSSRLVGVWRASRPLHLVDLVDLPALPSYWDIGKKRLRDVILFLRQFADQVTARVEPDDRSVDYRPTQAVSHALQELGAADGILYRSAKTAGACCVLFVDQSHCIHSGPTMPADELFLLLAGSEPSS